MTAEERHLVMSGLILLAALALGVFLHRSPDFAGSVTGNLLGIAGAMLMVLPTLCYLLVKRITILKTRVTRAVSLSTLLEWHVYTGIAGSLFAMLHTGHKFNSIVGMLLVVAMLATVFCGFVARYLVRGSTATVREKKELLTALELEYRHVGSEMRTLRISADGTPASAFSSPVGNSSLVEVRPGRRAQELVAAMAEVEYSIRMHDTLGRLFRWALNLHLIFAFAFFLLLGLHIWSGIHFGLRWLR